MLMSENLPPFEFKLKLALKSANLVTHYIWTFSTLSLALAWAQMNVVVIWFAKKILLSQRISLSPQCRMQSPSYCEVMAVEMKNITIEIHWTIFWSLSSRHLICQLRVGKGKNICSECVPGEKAGTPGIVRCWTVELDQGGSKQRPPVESKAKQRNDPHPVRRRGRGGLAALVAWIFWR